MSEVKFLSLILFCSFFSISIAKAKTCFTGYQYLKMINTKDTNKNCNDFDRYEQDIKEIFSYIKHRPPVVTLILSKDAPLESSYFFSGNRLILGIAENIKNSDEHVRSIFIHEVGHSIFQTLLEESIPELSGAKMAREKDNTNLLLTIQYLALLNKDSNCQSEECISFAMKHFSQLSEDEINDILNVENTLNWYESNHDKDYIEGIALHYHELFSDILAATYLENPRAISSALGFFNTKLRLHQSFYFCRSFDLATKISIYQKNQITDEHCSLSPIRFEIWQKILRPSILKMEKARAIEQMMQLFLQEIQFFIQRKKDQNLEFDANLAAKRLKSAISRSSAAVRKHKP